MSLDSLQVLGDGGHVARRLSHYESRSQQLEMATAVEHAIANGEHLIVEAGTGTGKSFAYLVPRSSPRLPVREREVLAARL